jgi:hypothetical protein
MRGNWHGWTIGPDHGLKLPDGCFFVSVFEGGGQYHVWQAYEHIMKGW